MIPPLWVYYGLSVLLCALAVASAVLLAKARHHLEEVQQLNQQAEQGLRTLHDLHSWLVAKDQAQALGEAIPPLPRSVLSVLTDEERQWLSSYSVTTPLRKRHD